MAIDGWRRVSEVSDGECERASQATEEGAMASPFALAIGALAKPLGIPHPHPQTIRDGSVASGRGGVGDFRHFHPLGNGARTGQLGCRQRVAGVLVGKPSPLRLAPP
jgi:hypothetical protein